MRFTLYPPPNPVLWLFSRFQNVQLEPAKLSTIVGEVKWRSLDRLCKALQKAVVPLVCPVCDAVSRSTRKQGMGVGMAPLPITQGTLLASRPVPVCAQQTSDVSTRGPQQFH